MKTSAVLSQGYRAKGGGAKRPKLGTISDNNRILWRISSERIDKSKQELDQLNPFHVGEKIFFGELWSTNKKVLRAHNINQP